MYEALFAITMLLLFLGANRQPAVILSIMLTMFAFEQILQANSNLFLNRGSLVNVSTGLLVCIGLFFCFTKIEFKPQIPRSYWLAVALFSYAYLSFYWSGQSSTRQHGIWLSNVPYLISILLFGSLLISSPRGLFVGLAATVALGSVICLDLAFLETWQGRGLYFEGNEDFDGSILALAQVGGYTAVIAGTLQLKKLPFWKIARWLLVGLGLYITFKTNSRGQTLALFGAILATAPLSSGQLSRRSITTAAAAFLALAICLYIIVPLVSMDRWEQNRINEALENRYLMIESLFTEFLYAGPITWFFGLGAGSSWKTEGFYIHNVPVEILCEEGIIGFGLLCMIVYPILRRSGQLLVTRPAAHQHQERNILVVTLTLLLFELLNAFKQGSLYQSQNLFLLLIITDRLTLQILLNNSPVQTMKVSVQNYVATTLPRQVRSN